MLDGSTLAIFSASSSAASGGVVAGVAMLKMA
jgi:hypothetical protein